MVVKLIDGRWEVITFIADHNHPLIDKPSLSKYLRSHQGIPPEQKKFLTHLNDSNLIAGTTHIGLKSFYHRTVTYSCIKYFDLRHLCSFFMQLCSFFVQLW